jgi:OPA family glycerol-3-phosphate transporter-like MFS transporter
MLDRPHLLQPGFRRRRAMNWVSLGLLYAAYYMARYNITIANPILRETFGWSKEQLGMIVAAGFWTYGLSVFFNGPIADRIGGRKAILMGGSFVVIFSLLFGVAPTLTGMVSQSASVLLTVLIVCWMMINYWQSFGALSIVKVNAAWFHVRERGVFGGIFGIMIQAGRLGIMAVGGLIVTYLSWQYVFFIPAGLLLLIVLWGKFAIANAPDDAGFEYLDPGDGSDQEKDVTVNYTYIIKKVFTNKIMLTIAAAEFCTGFVRHGIDQWFPSYMREVHHVAFNSKEFLLTAVGMPIGAILGGLLAGTLSDKMFGSRRPPVAALFFAGQGLALIGLHFSQYWGPFASIWMFMLVSMCIQGTHSLLSGVASMDFGGKKAAASAAGLFDGCQYIAGGIVGIGLGWMLDTFGWDNWVWSILGFSIMGSVLMLTLWHARPSGQLSIDFDAAEKLKKAKIENSKSGK